MNELILTYRNLQRFWDNIKSMIGTANGIATLDESGKIPQSQLPNTATYETTIIYTTFDEETNTYMIDEESVNLLRGYDGGTTMFLYEPLGQLYIPYVGNNEFVIDVFGASIYFRVDLDTRICTFSVGEWVSLDENGEVSPEKIPSIIVYGYYRESRDLFYEDEEYRVLIPHDEHTYKKFFVDLGSNTLYGYYKGQYISIMRMPGSLVSSNVEYMPDKDYEKMMKDLGI